MQAGEAPIDTNAIRTPADEARISAGELIPQRPKTAQQNAISTLLPINQMHDTPEPEIEESDRPLISPEEYAELGIPGFINLISELQTDPEFGGRDIRITHGGITYLVHREIGRDNRTILSFRPLVFDPSDIQTGRSLNPDIKTDKKSGFVVFEFDGENPDLNMESLKGVAYHDRDRRADGRAKFMSRIREQSLTKDEMLDRLQEIIPTDDEFFDSKNEHQIRVMQEKN